MRAEGTERPCMADMYYYLSDMSRTIHPAKKKRLEACRGANAQFSWNAAGPARES